MYRLQPKRVVADHARSYGLCVRRIKSTATDAATGSLCRNPVTFQKRMFGAGRERCHEGSTLHGEHVEVGVSESPELRSNCQSHHARWAIVN